MYDCEICGRHVNSLYVIDVEGAELSVCERCSRGKIVTDTIGEGRKEVKARKRADEPVEDELIERYGEAIRKAREALGLPLNVLAEKINEKESTMLRVEKERMQPSMKLIAKLEKELGIKLTRKAEIANETHVPRSVPITLGEAAFRKEDE